MEAHAKRRISQNVSPSLSDAYLYYNKPHCSLSFRGSAAVEEVVGVFREIVVAYGQLERSCEKLRSVTQNQGGEEHPTYGKRKEG